MFLLAGPAAAQETAQAHDRQVEIEFWQSVKQSNDPEEIRAYLEAFPDGSFAALAGIRLRRLGAATVAPEADITPPDQNSGGDAEPLEAADIPPPPKTLKRDNYLGAYINFNRAGGSGGAIVSVLDGGPAANWGLQAGDIIYSVDDRPVNSLEELTSINNSYEPGRALKYGIIRNGKTTEVSVAVGDRVADLWRKAHKSDAVAQVELGQLYGLGETLPESQGEAIYWFLRAAALGNAVAMRNLGVRYQIGKGVNKDLNKAVEWFQKSADAGNLDALTGLAYMHQNGWGGLQKDVSTALRMYREAADQGNPSGLFNMGVMYENGRGVRKDLNEAIHYYRLAAAGDARASGRLEELGKPLYDPKEIQRLLKHHGFYDGKIDGISGKQTKKAIREFLTASGAEATGEMSVALERRLKSFGRDTQPAAASVGRLPSVKTAGAASANANTDINTSIDPIGDLGDLDDLDALD